MARCVGLKRDGSQCTATVDPPQRYCWWHDPKHADQRSRAASKAARSKPSKEIKDLKKQLEDLADAVLKGRVDRGDAIAVNQIINTRAWLIELEGKIKEQEEFEQRLKELEELAARQQSPRYGAR